jgi:ribosomal protein S18 acetylase RimI-like enzyme
MEIGQLRASNRSRLAELLVATGAFHAAEIDVALSLFDFEMRRKAGDGPADYEFVGAFEEGELAGYACFGPTPATEGTYDLYWLAVYPALQGRGIGRALVRAVEAQLVARDARLLIVETSSRASYAATRQFYVRGGYTEAARVRDFYAPADDRILLTTRLTTRDGGAAIR